jgi:hypothetical protein
MTNQPTNQSTNQLTFLVIRDEMKFIKFSPASSRISWLKMDKTDVSRIISASLRTRTEMVLETSVLSIFNQLTRLEAQENFINFSRRESFKSYMK